MNNYEQSNALLILLYGNITFYSEMRFYSTKYIFAIISVFNKRSDDFLPTHEPIIQSLNKKTISISLWN